MPIVYVRSVYCSLIGYKINCSISLLRKYVKRLFTKTGTKCLKRKDFSFYIFELTQHFKQRKQALVLFANNSLKKGINNK